MNINLLMLFRSPHAHDIRKKISRGTPNNLVVKYRIVFLC